MGKVPGVGRLLLFDKSVRTFTSQSEDALRLGRDARPRRQQRELLHFEFFESGPKAIERTNASCYLSRLRLSIRTHFEGFDPGSERTLAAWIRHASRTN